MMPIRFRSKTAGRYGKRPVKGEMTQAEAAYAELLFARKHAGEIVRWYFQAMTFVLAEGCRFTPDFAVEFPDGTMELIDAKGGGPIADDALVKIKCAAEKFDQFGWAIEQRRSKKDGGGFERREF